MLQICFGILLLSAATLLFEITLTRVFSVAEWYHFAFMVVSLALLGFGASGSLLSLFPRLLGVKLKNSLAVCAGLFSVGSLGGYLVVNSIPFDSYRLAWESRQLLYLAVYYLSLAVPFFFTGLALGVALSQLPSQAGKLYGFSMVGSGLGCLLVLITPSFFGINGTVVLAAWLGLVAALVLSLPGFRLLIGWATAGIVGLIILLINSSAGLEIRMSPYKSLSQLLFQPQTRILWTGWNAFSRVDVVKSDSIHIAPGLSLNYRQALPPQLGITVDGADLSPLSQVETEQADFTNYLPGALAYQLLPNAKVLVIEPQGGLDVLTALHHRSSSVVAVLSNPLVVKAVEKFGEKGRWIDDPRVKVVVEGARSYLRHSEEEFDIIQLSLTDSFRVLGAGAYSLSENYRYTLEAFKEYYEHLASGGILSVTRWLQVPPSEEIRLMALVITTLEELGVTHPEQHVAAIRSFQTLTVLVKENPFRQQDVAIIRDFADKLGFDVVYFPGINIADLNRYNVLPREVYYEALVNLLTPSTRGTFLDNYPFDISPPTDNRPFFFHFFKWQQVPYIWSALGKTWQPFGGFGYLLIVALLLTAVLASVVFILLPLYFRPREKGKTGQTLMSGAHWQVFGYFAGLGLGFMFVEIPLMQKFILFLDQPVYAFAAVLGAIFVFSGLGSLLSTKIGKVLPQVVVSLSLLAFLYPVILSYLFEAWLGQSLLVRLVIALVALAPLSFLMGVPFPCGIRMISLLSPDLIPWAWGINGCVSVVSSILSLMIALAVGFSWVLVAAGGAYFFAAGIALYWLKEMRRISPGRGIPAG
ncbi:MAG TPA: hypothetical protein G4O01_05055 [Dehalococcoidia bacterium]|jgi:spermidine synthase|nr:hypothetical protein [Dehalococcoidia bacterium]